MKSMNPKKILESMLEDMSLECILADIAEPESFSQLFALLKKFFQKAKEINFLELAEDAKKAGKIVKMLMEQKDYKEDSEQNKDGSDSNLDAADALLKTIPYRQDRESLIESLNQIISEMKSFLHFIEDVSDGINNPDASSDLLPQNLTLNEPADELEENSRKYSKDIKENKEQKQNKEDNQEKEREQKKERGQEKEDEQEQQEQEQKHKTPKNSKQSLAHPGKLPSFLNLEDFAEFLSIQRNTLDKMEMLILDIEKNNNKNYAQGELKRIFHTTKGEAGFLGLKDVETICHKAEDLMGEDNFGNIVDTLLAVKDWLEESYKIYSGEAGYAPSLENILSLFEQKNKTGSYKESQQKEFKQKGLQQKELQRSDQSDDQEDPFETLNPKPTTSVTSILNESINVDALRLDRMVNIIGELAIAESMVTQSPEITSIASSNLLRALSSLHKITKELHTLGLSLRMVPLKSLFHRMDRVARDLAKKTSKKIQFTIKGESTELDKTIVDKLGDPLIHLVRNSVDHGVEDSVQERVNAGKPETANIELRAFHKGGYLFIEVEDDGKGINREKLAAKAIEQGIITIDDLSNNGKTISDDMLNLVFHPGLSTASEVTDVSGRGVGMDVVRKSIESCRGKVFIASNEGTGSVCTIKIPLTLSIIDGLVVSAAQEVYVIPTLSVVTSLKVDKNTISNVFEKGEMINVLGKLIPLFRLNKLFKLKGSAKDAYNGIVIVVEDNGFRTALLVDEVIGKQSTVIKNLGIGMEQIEGISGGTIMPNGRVSLILDVAGIVELSRKGL